MADLFVTVDEIKVFLNITDTTKDALITAYIEPMTDVLLDCLGVTDLSVHETVDERVEVYEFQRLYFKNFPVDVSLIAITDLNGDSIDDYTFKKDPGNLRQVYLYDSNGVRSSISADKILATYTAGYAYASQASNSVPDTFKLALALMVGGSVEDIEKVQEYEILDKRVKFKNAKDYNLFNTVMSKYISKKPVILS